MNAARKTRRRSARCTPRRLPRATRAPGLHPNNPNFAARSRQPRRNKTASRGGLDAPLMFTLRANPTISANNLWISKFLRAQKKKASSTAIGLAFR